MRRCRFILFLALAACQPSPTALKLELACTPATVFARLSVRVRSSALVLDATRTFPLDGGAGVRLPDHLVVPVADQAALFEIEATGVDAAGRRRVASGSVTSLVNQTVRLTLDLSLPAQCTNGTKDSDEGDVDCGGTLCPACPVGSRCAADLDCQTTSCATQNICSLASGPPFWRTGAAFNPPRTLFAAATVFDGRIFATGGTTNLTTDLARVDIYDPRLDAWTTGPALPAARSSLGLAFLGGKLYAIGGDPAPLRVDTLVPGQTTWSPGPALPKGHSEAGVAVSRGRLFVAGGFEAGNPTDRVDVLEADGGWTPGQPLRTNRAGLTLVPAADGTLYSVGGGTYGDEVATVDRFEADLNLWTQTAPMPTARNGVAAIEGPDGRVWAAGGSRAGSLDVVEVYFPRPIDKWVEARHLLKDRSHGSAQLHPDGRLIVFGGLSSGLQPTSVELYGPVVTVNPTMLAAGGNAQISGDNFAADAGVTLTLLSGDNPVLGRGSTNATGALDRPISFAMPQVAPGTHRLQVIDSRSRYPIVLEVVVTQ